MQQVTDTLGRLETLRSRADRQHELCVGTVTEIIGRQLGFEKARAAAIGQAAVLHDIGKLVLPDAVLHKPAGLSIAEGETVKMHCRLGHDLLRDNDGAGMQLAAMIALRHHECVDGSGYPDRLLGKYIPIEARIVAAADVYSALREPRSYKQAMTHEQALKIITQGDGRVRPQQFDANVVSALIAAGAAVDRAYAVQLMLT